MHKPSSLAALLCMLMAITANSVLAAESNFVMTFDDILKQHRASMDNEEVVDENETGEHRRDLHEARDLKLYSAEQIAEENRRDLAASVSEVTSSYVVYGGRKYMTLDMVDPKDNSSGCQVSPIQLPAGFQLAVNEKASKQVITLFGWGTHCVLLADGSSWGTQNYYPGSDCYYNPELHALEYNLGGYVPRGCNRRILIVEKPNPAMPPCDLDACIARNKNTCQKKTKKQTCSCQLTGRKRAGMATVLDPLAKGYHNRVYRTLDGTTYDNENVGCQTDLLPIPTGYTLASTWEDWEARTAASLYPWGTKCVVVVDGPNGYTSWETFLEAKGQKIECTEDGLVNEDVSSKTIKIAKCDRRILLQKDDLGFKCLPA